MEFRILGPVEVWDGARPLDRGGLKPRALLAVLLVHANQVVSTDHLVDELWGEAPPPTVRNLVQVYVSRLRRAAHPSRGGRRPAPGLGAPPAPPTVRNLVQVYVSRLRRALHHSRGGSTPAPVLVTRPPGYLLRV